MAVRKIVEWFKASCFWKREGQEEVMRERRGEGEGEGKNEARRIGRLLCGIELLVSGGGREEEKDEGEREEREREKGKRRGRQN